MRPLLTLLLAALPAPLLAQTSFPMVTHANPVAVQRGHSAEVTVEGQENFAGTYKVLVEGTGVSAEVIAAPTLKSGPRLKTKLVKLKITVEPNAAPGVREFRIATSLGLSSLGQLLIVDEPVIVESAPNNTPAQATSVVLPCVVCGRIEVAEDVDCYKFPAPRRADPHLRGLRRPPRRQDSRPAKAP